MYYYNGNPLRLDKAFTDVDGNQYPANWLRNSTQEQRDALGITWVAPDPAAYYDQRFYWGPGIPKDLDQLKELWVAKQKEIASSLLTPTDWMVIRSIDNPSIPISSTIFQYRADVRSVSDLREAQVNSCVNVEALEELIKAPATIEVVTQVYVPANGNTPEVPEVLETQVNPAAMTAWPELV